MEWINTQNKKVFSREYSHKDFCLAHLFTDLKFEGGILGLAYVGSPRRNSVGGICTPGALNFQFQVFSLSGSAPNVSTLNSSRILQERLHAVPQLGAE